MQQTSRRTVVFLESAAAMGGVQFSTLYLAQNLNQSHWKPIVVCPAEGDLTRVCRAANIEAHVVGYPRLWSTSVRIGQSARLPNLFAWLWNALGLVRSTHVLKHFLRQTSPDVLVTKGLASHFMGGLAGRRLGIPCVWHVQDLISERNFGIYRRIFGFAARWLPQHIIVDGIAIKEQLPSSINARVSIVHNGVDMNVFRPGRDGSRARQELGITAEQLVLGHVARVTPWKGQHYLIEAFAQIAQHYPNLVLLFVGSPVFDHDAYELRLRAMAKNLGLQHRIKFAGYRHDLPNILAAMDIFAYTSVEKDTSPLALLSAMASGLPIVAFDIRGIRELVEDSATFLLSRVGDIASLAKSVASLISDLELRMSLGQHARRTAAAKFSVENYNNGIEAILNQICRAATGTISNADSEISAMQQADGVKIAL